MSAAPDRVAATLSMGSEFGAAFPWGSLAEPTSAYFRASLSERVAIIKHGVPATYVGTLSNGMGISKSRLCRITGIPRSSIYRKLRSNSRLNQRTSERIMWIAHLIGQFQRFAAQSGYSRGFDAASWLADWLDQGHPVLKDRTPADFFETAEGRSLISSLLAEESDPYETPAKVSASEEP